MSDDRAVRRFVSPSGRTWTATLFVPRDGSPGLLRFQSEQLVLDLNEYPSDWFERSDDELVALARSAQPPSYRPA